MGTGKATLTFEVHPGGCTDFCLSYDGDLSTVDRYRVLSALRVFAEMCLEDGTSLPVSRDERDEERCPTGGGER